MSKQCNLQSKITPKPPSAKLLARAGVFVALLAASAQIAIPLPGAVPITLQTLTLMLCAVALPPLYTLAAVGTYVLAGLCGVPLFTKFQGTAAFFSPTGGFIIGFVPTALFLSLGVGLIEKITHKARAAEPAQTGQAELNDPLGEKKSPAQGKRIFKYTLLVLFLLGFTALTYAFGLLYFMVTVNTGFRQAFFACALPFLPGDAVKCAAVVFAYVPIVKLRKW